MLKISNTLSGKLEEFHPLDEKQVRMYTCGPTVYDYAHIGNFRTFVFQDVLKRYLRFKGYQVFHVMNITDVDDKTIRNSAASNPAQLRAYTDQFTAAFFEDCGKLRIQRPDVVAHATDHIPEMVALIQTLNSKGYTYEKEGSIYFRIAQFKDYGKLSKLDADGIMAGARVDVDEYGKQDARDFVLWKATKNGEPHWDCFGPRPAGMARGMFSHEHEVSRRILRSPLRCSRSGLSASRERDCAERGSHREAVCALLDARRASDC